MSQAPLCQVLDPGSCLGHSLHPPMRTRTQGQWVGRSVQKWKVELGDKAGEREEP